MKHRDPRIAELVRMAAQFGVVILRVEDGGKIVDLRTSRPNYAAIDDETARQLREQLSERLGGAKK